MDNGGLEVGYDVKQGKYYVSKDVVLAPLEKAVYNIEVDDIWTIDVKYLSELKEHSRSLAGKLARSEYKAVAEKLNSVAERDIAAIIKRQEDYAIDKTVPVEHINAYETNKASLESVRKDIGTMENLVIGLGGDAGKIMGESAIGARALDEVAQEAERSAGLKQTGAGDAKGEAAAGKTVVLKIEVSNSSKTETRTIPVAYYLPPEVRKDDIIDSKELEPRLDFERSVYYLHNPGITLGPGQNRVFEVIIKDKWSVSEAKLLAMKVHVASMTSALSGTKEFASIEGLGRQAMAMIDDMMKGSGGTLDEKYVADFQARQRKMEDVEKIIGRMEDLLRQAGVTPDVTVLDENRIKELADGSGVSEQRLKQIQNMLIEGKSDYGTGPDPKGVKLLAGTIFKGKAPSTATTWKVIFIIIGFLAVIGGVYFIIWTAQASREKKIEEIKSESNDTKS